MLEMYLPSAVNSLPYLQPDHQLARYSTDWTFGIRGQSDDLDLHHQIQHFPITPPLRHRANLVHAEQKMLVPERRSQLFPPASAGSSYQDNAGGMTYQSSGHYTMENSNQSTRPMFKAVEQVKQDHIVRQPSRPASPTFSQPENEGGSSRSSNPNFNPIVPYLQIPSSISTSKGSLAELAAQITCLLWFESSPTLSCIENSDQAPLPTSRLVEEAIPVTGFLKWVTTILSTTQVTQNVILLALLFIYRLKKQNPFVKGKPGSEYRLLTVALMLGNKFLDDNTYTNKTWAEVSGISVHEIHVMEVEFLSHMKYNLYTSKEEWHQWHQQLGKFWTYFDRASKKAAEPVVKQLRPTLHIPHPLPSPPSSTSASPPFIPQISPSSTTFPSLGALPPHLVPQYHTMAVSPASSLPDQDRRATGRKRSHDQTNHESNSPASKRHSAYGTFYNQQYAPSTEAMMPSLPSLPLHNVPLPNNHLGQYGSDVATSTARPMAQPYTVNRHTPIPYLPSVNWLQGVEASPVTNYYQDRDARVHTPTTPASYNYSRGTPAQKQLSPSHFLTQRTSPYRPVRGINQLLVPPPSTSTANPTSTIPQDQLHWQPLSKGMDDTRTGRVPYFHREAWPRTHQAEHWPQIYPVR